MVRAPNSNASILDYMGDFSEGARAVAASQLYLPCLCGPEERHVTGLLRGAGCRRELTVTAVFPCLPAPAVTRAGVGDQNRPIKHSYKFHS